MHGTPPIRDGPGAGHRHHYRNFAKSPMAPQIPPKHESKLTAGGSGAEGRDGGDGKKSEGGELHGCDTVTARKRVD